MQQRRGADIQACLIEAARPILYDWDMAEHETFTSWWRAVPREEKPALKVLFSLFLIVMTLGSVAILAPHLS